MSALTGTELVTRVLATIAGVGDATGIGKVGVGTLVDRTREDPNRLKQLLDELAGHGIVIRHNTDDGEPTWSLPGRASARPDTPNETS